MAKESVLGYLFSRSARSFKRAVNQGLEQFDLTITQCGVIRTLRYAKELTQAQIADIYASDRATIGAVIQKLMDKKYLEKKLSGTDRRAYVVSLTPRAIEIADEIQVISEQIERRALEGLSEEEIQIFLKAMNVIIKNLDEDKKD